MVNPLVVLGAVVAIIGGALGVWILPTCGAGWSLLLFGVMVIGIAIVAAGAGGAPAAPYIVIFGFFLVAIGLVAGHGAACTLP